MVKLELSIEAKNLKNVAGAFKGTSDPFAVVTQVATTADERPRVIGKTEIVKNNLSPHWAKIFTFEYQLGTPAKLAINIFDEVRKSDNKSMGSTVFEVDSLLSARGGTKTKKIRNGGTVTAVIRKSQGAGVLRFKMSGEGLKNQEGFLRKSDPFFELVRRDDTAGGATFNTVFRSEVVKDNLSPDWKQASIELSQLCGGNFDLPFFVKIYDHESDGKHESMGQFETTVNAMVQGAGNASIPVKLKGKDAGTVVLHKAELSLPQSTESSEEGVEEEMAQMSVSPSAIPRTANKPTFIDYVSGGCQLNVTVAIDFTGSNGDPRQPGTLHYLHQDGQLNDYEKAIMSILSILQKYDSDKKFPVLGFGAKYNGEIRHAFQCGTASEAVGVKGVLSAYRDVFGSGLVMSRPTVFNEVIEYAAGRAEQSLDAALASGGQTYSILLLLTDGCVSDIPATAECLKGIADKPISVVMVVSATVIFFCCSEVWHNIVILLSHASDRVWDRLTFRAWTFWTAWASRECGM
mmetsp:Transcript_5818/g.13760  ORF Transcript_5818/g.13760 Transcript_5818/m.13760 type:complete len:519 (+) Transcript_5818:78-1634(+)